MTIWAMSDLHLPISNPSKSMSVFGPAWDNYVERIRASFNDRVSPTDTVLMPGDLSWVMYIRDGYDDFKFIDDLPGHKIISRGNHDYFWTTVKKMEETFSSFGLSTIEIARNNVIEVEGSLITGTRGWKMPFDSDFSAEDRKVFDREVIRLGLCMDALNRIDPEKQKRHIVMLHYPPITNTHLCTEFSKILEENHVDICIYGHLHGRAQRRLFEGEHNGVLYRCVAADYLGFKPLNLDAPYVGECEFRAATEADKKTVESLYSSVVGTPFCTWNELYPSSFEIDDDFMNSNLFVLNKANEGPIGAISIVHENELNEFDCWSVKESAAEFARVVINPKYQGQGMSKHLVQGIISEIISRGFKTIHISVAKCNVPALKLYQSIGFKIVGSADMYGNSYHLCELEIM